MRTDVEALTDGPVDNAFIPVADSRFICTKKILTMIRWHRKHVCAVVRSFYNMMLIVIW